MGIENVKKDLYGWCVSMDSFIEAGQIREALKDIGSLKKGNRYLLLREQCPGIWLVFNLSVCEVMPTTSNQLMTCLSRFWVEEAEAT